MISFKQFETYSILLLIVCFTFKTVCCQSVISPDLVVKSVDRSVDLTSQITKITTKIVIENAGKSSAKSVLYSLEPDVRGKVSHISATSEAGKNVLKTIPTKVSAKDAYFWQVDLKEPLQPGKTATFEVECILTDALLPYPTSITQKERQLVKYIGNGYVYLPYKSLKQSTVFHLLDKNIEFFSKINPVAHSTSENTITYGPYQNLAAFSSEPLVIHFENNSPFLKVTRLERTIEVSHWGNIAIEETVDLLHVGAALKGAFSRYEFQREAHSGLSSVKSFKTLLPASASDVYYRDDIGNISTSHMKTLTDSVEVDLRPRFPLFGGWKTHYTLGYNVPSYEYLYHSGDNFKLKIRMLDHVFDDMVIDELITHVILPEGSDKIKIKTPFEVTRLPDTRHKTYLDTKGRYMISMTAKNLVENHIQDLEVDYEFPRLQMLNEPLLVVFALYLLFLLVIVYVRLDFSISKDEVGESKMRVSGLVEKIMVQHDARMSSYKDLDEQLAKLKSSKESNVYLNNVKSIQQQYKNACSQITELLTKLKRDSPDCAEKVSETQKLDKQLKEIYAQKQSLYLDKLVPGKIGRGQFVETENLYNKKKDDILEKITNIMKSVH